MPAVVIAELADQRFVPVGFAYQHPFGIVKFLYDASQLGCEFQAFLMEKVVLEMLKKDGKGFVLGSESKTGRVIAKFGSS